MLDPIHESDIRRLAGRFVAAAVVLLALSSPATAQGSFDCGDFWQGGFPERWQAGALPCTEIAGSGTPATYRLFHDDALDPSELAVSQIEAVEDALSRSFALFSNYGTVPATVVVLTDRQPAYPDDEHSAAMAYTGHPGPGEPCPVVIFELSTRHDLPLLQQDIAHEIFHCFQERRWTLTDEWFTEGTAEYFSNLVFPAANHEHEWARDYAPLVDLLAQSYEATHFFQAAANSPGWGPEQIVALGDRLEGATSQAQTFSQAPGMQDAFHAFAQGATTGSVRDEDGSFLPKITLANHVIVVHEQGLDVTPDCGPCLTAGTSLASMSVAAEPRNVVHLDLTVIGPARFVLRASSSGVESRASYSKGDRWYALPERLEIDTCRDSDFVDLSVVLTTTEATSGAAKLTLELEEASPCSCPAPLTPPTACAVGTWDFDMTNMRRLVGTMAAAFSRSVPGTAGSSGVDFRVHRVDGSMTVASDGRFRNTMSFEAQSEVRLAGGETGRMIFDHYERGQEGQVCIDPATNHWHFLDQTTTETIDGKLVIDTPRGSREQPIRRSTPIVNSEDAELDWECTDQTLRLTGPYVNGQKLSLGIEWSATRRTPPP